MALDSAHPEYVDMAPEWVKMRDVYKGERHVKERGTTYLPATKGMRLDGFGANTAAGVVNVGQEAYDAYRLRAVVPDYLQDAVEAFIGLLHAQPAKIELPEAMEPLREKITQHGESMELLLRRINEEQLVTGRLGLLTDLPENPDPANPLPYIALYIGEAIRNWDDGSIDEGETKLNMVLLDESGYRRNGFEWDVVAKFRVLELEPISDESGNFVRWGVYRQGVFESLGGGVPNYVEADLKSPMLRATMLEEIPFTFVNTKDIVASPDKPPLLGLANTVLTIYRGEADYRQNLFMQGQDTLVISGDLKHAADVDPNELQPTRGNVLNTDTPLRTGAGSMIHLETGGTAEYKGVSANGISEQRTALENDRKAAEGKSGALASDNASANESGEALKTRVAARTASLNQIAKTGAAALEKQLKGIARWMGADENKVKVEPNLEFADFQLDGASLAAIVGAKIAGAPLSWESVHSLMARGNLTELDYKAEKELLDKEREEMPPAGTNAGGDPEEDDDDNTPPAQQ
jgi:hypothetical protein